MTKLERLLKQDGLFIGAHRGFSSRYPENTLLAVKEAADLNVDVIEVDVYTTRDGVPVIAHDDHLERCSTGHGNIHEYTLKELKALDFGIHRGPQYEGLRLPTFEQFLDMMKCYPNIIMDIDFKYYAYTLETVKHVIPMLESNQMMDRCVFNCVDCSVIDYLTENYGKRAIGAPHDNPWCLNRRDGKGGYLDTVWGICIPLHALDDEHVTMYRDQGITIITTPCDTPEAVQKALKYNVTMPLCDDPREYLRVDGR